MPGGSADAWALVAEMLKAIAAKAAEDGKPCVTYLGPRSAGHYVKMVHNGIEYGDMQPIRWPPDLKGLVQDVVSLGDELHIAVFDAVVHHFDVVTSRAWAQIGHTGLAILLLQLWRQSP